MKRLRISPTAAAALLLSVLLCAAFYDVVFLNRTFKVTTANSQAMPTGVYGQEDNKPPFIPVNGTDAPVLEEPIYEFIRQNLAQGILPLWNPHQACGYALIGMIQAAIFYPLNLILYTLPSLYSWDILILIRLLLAGIFTYSLMKTLRFKDAPALAAAVTFMLSGPMVLLQYWTANVDILLPLLLLCFEKMIRAPGRRNCAWLGLVIGLTILGGHPEHIFLVNAYGLIFLLFRALSLKGIKKTLKMFPIVSAAYFLGAGIAALVLFPFIQNFLTEFWHGHPPGTGLLMEEHLERIITLAVPHFFQKAPVTYDWTFAGWWGGYLGIFPLALAVMGLFNRQRKGLNIFFGVMAFVIIAKEYGMPVINWLGHLPLFSLVRYAIHTPPLAAFSVAVLAGMGVRAVIARKSMAAHGAVLSVLLTAVISVYLVILRNSPHIQLSLKSSALAGLLLVFFLLILILKKKKLFPAGIIAVMLIAAVFFELSAYIHRKRPKRFDSFPDVPYLNMLKRPDSPVRSYGNFWAFYPNTATGYAVDDLGFFMGLAPKRFVRFVNKILVPDLFRDNFRSPALRSIPVLGRENFLDMLNVHYIILPSNERFIRPFRHFGDYTAKLKKVYNKEVCVYQRPHALPRAFMVYDVIVENDAQAALNHVKDLGGRLRRKAVITPAPGENPPPAMRDPGLDFSRVTFKRYTPNRVELTVSARHAGLLVLSDAYHPDWKAYINGKETRIYQTNYLIRSIFVPKGDHHVIFQFRPFWFYAGAAVTGISLMIFLALLLIPKKIRPDDRMQSPVLQ